MPLEVRGLSVEVSGKRILDGVSITVERGDVAILMGPNGSGKTTLAYALLGHPRYRVVGGSIVMDGEDITNLPTYERAMRGLTLAFQNPVEVPGVRLGYLLNIINAKRVKGFDLTYVDPRFVSWARSRAAVLGLAPEFFDRDVNVGFSGGERKRSEVLQVLALKPKYVVLDEPDSGLDVDGIRVVGEAIGELSREGAGVLVITHHADITKFVRPSRAYVLLKGRVAMEGGPELVDKVLMKGYEALALEVGR